MKLPWMKLSERRMWRSALTVQDLADLTARWLEGTIGSQPGYQPRYGPDSETADLVETLAACNRAGYLTIGSQPGLITEHVRQRAAVEGFTADMKMLRRLETLAASIGLRTAVHLISAPSEPVDGFKVTISEGEPFTAFGRHLEIRDLAVIWQGCSRTAVDAVAAAYQVTVVDPEYGRTDRLLAVLDEAAGLSGPVCSDCGCTEHTPCPGGCAWMPSSLFYLCSSCYESEFQGAYQRFMATLGPDGTEDQPETGPVYLLRDDFGDANDGDGVENECKNCGAPYFHSGCDGPFCTGACAEVGAEAAAYVAPVDLVKRQHQSWGWPVGDDAPF